MSNWRWEGLVLLLLGCALAMLTWACDDTGSAEAAVRVKPHGDALTGACSGADREKYVHDPNPKFITQLRDCSKDTWANKHKNLACLAKVMPSLSKECAGCFADMASCALASCKMACMFSSTSDGCTKCANSKCQPSLIKCSGVARADLP